MHRRHLRWLWVVLALFFLLEAWLWDHLKPVVARVVAFVSLGPIRDGIRRLVERLPPWAALGVFAVPLIVLLPLKFIEVYFIAERRWFAAVGVLVLAKLLGLGVTAFVFDATRDKLLQISWFARLYAWFVWTRAWAHEQIEPVRARLRRMMWLLAPHRAGTFRRRLARLRARAFRPPA